MAVTQKKKNCTFYMYEETIGQLKQISRAKGQSKADIIRDAIQPMVIEAEAKEAKPTIIVFANQKGNSSKTTTALAIGIILGQRGRTVLLLDLDARGDMTEHASTAECKTFDLEGVEPCIADVMISNDVGNRMVLADVLCTTKYENVSMIPSSIALDGADARMPMEPSPSIGSRLKHAIDEFLETHSYDYIIIDCPSSLGMLTSNAISALEAGNPSSFVVIPVKPDGFSSRCTRSTLDLVNAIAKERRKKPRECRVLWTSVNEHSAAYEESKRTFAKNFPGIDAFNTEIRFETDIACASACLTTVLKYNPTSAVLGDFNSLADEIEG